MSNNYLNPPLPPPQSTTPAEAGVYALLTVLADPAKHKQMLEELHAERAAAEKARHEARSRSAEADVKLDEAHDTAQHAEEMHATYTERLAILDQREKSLKDWEDRLHRDTHDHATEFNQRETNMTVREVNMKQREQALDAAYMKHGADVKQFEKDRLSLQRKLDAAKAFIQA